MPNHEVAVVGLGPAGAFVARAAYDMGYRVTVYVHGAPSVTPPGAFWLHWVPDDVTGEFSSKPITILGKGKPENYTKLQWGPSWYKGLTSSFPTEPVVEEGYNPAEVLPKLVPDEVKVEYMPYPLSDMDVDDLSKGFDFVFQTFPRKAHIQEQPARIPFVAVAKFNCFNPDQNVVVYNGTGQGDVVREARLFGNHFLEFPKHKSKADVLKDHPEIGVHSHAIVELKDLDPRSEPVDHPGNKVYLMGRLAQWDKKCLSHDCYQRTIEVLNHG